MGKSIRSKRLKRLRTLKRELVAPHYDAKELAKLAAQEAAAQAPKIELPNTRRRSESEAMGKSLIYQTPKIYPFFTVFFNEFGSMYKSHAQVPCMVV
jgi:hypothetical protein